MKPKFNLESCADVCEGTLVVDSMEYCPYGDKELPWQGEIVLGSHSTMRLCLAVHDTMHYIWRTKESAENLVDEILKVPCDTPYCNVT